MTRRRRTLLVGVVVVVVVAVVAVVVVRRVSEDDGTRLQRAVALAPPGSQRLSWTDWAGVRDELGTGNLTDLLDEGFTADLTSTSALVESATTLQQRFGFSPQTLEWELFAQDTSARRGAHGPRRRHRGHRGGPAARPRLHRAGRRDGVWLGSDDLLARDRRRHPRS